MKYLIALLVAITLVGAEIERYEGYKVFRVTVENEEQARLLIELEETSTEFDFWSGLRKNGPSDIMVSPKAQNDFQQMLVTNQIPFEIIIDDVEPVLAQERDHQLRSLREPDGRISFTAYQRYGNIQSYLQQLERDYPQLVTLQTAATSTQGRSVVGIIISTGASSRKPVILIDSGIHAREWIAPAQSLYIIQELVENSANRHLIQNVDWHIIPVLNPDGYEFTHTNTRLWRKTRSQRSGVSCIGVDGNRNFDFHWMGPGASSQACAETYAGPNAFSEPETGGIRTWVNRYASRIKVYVAIHSYGNYILYPWGYTSQLPPDWLTLHNLGLDAAAGIRAIANTRYTVGSSTNVLYAASGGADDWVKGVGGVNVSYTFELPGGGSSGFDLPPARIAAVVRETWEAFVVLHNFAQLQEV